LSAPNKIYDDNDDDDDDDDDNDDDCGYSLHGRTEQTAVHA